MSEKTNIRKFRVARNWTQPRMAEELGVHLATLVRLESKDAIDKRTSLALEQIARTHPIKSRNKELSG